MKQRIFYQSSLPRSGSTLLQNVIGQNPDFHVTPTSGMIDLVLGARVGYNANQESKAGDLAAWKKGFYAFCSEGLNGYAKSLTNKQYILDKNRAWGPYYSLLNKIQKGPKIVFMVRDLRAIFASMEKKFRLNPDIDTGELNNDTLENITTQQRVFTWSKGFPIGYAVNKLHQSILDKTAENFLFIKYEDFCNNPQENLNSIYDFFNLERYEHDTSSIDQVTNENDALHGIYGDHTIRNKVEMLPNDFEEILGKQTSDWIYNNYEWYFNIFKYNK